MTLATISAALFVLIVAVVVARLCVGALFGLFGG